MPLPPDPPVISRPEELPVGDAVAGAHWRAVRSVLDSLEPEHPGLTVEMGVLDAGAWPGDLERWYAARLGEGWAPLPLDLKPPAWGFARHRGDRLLAVVGLDPGSGPRPVGLISNLEPGPDRRAGGDSARGR